MARRRSHWIKMLSSSEDETISLAQALAKNLSSGDLIALHGDLGAGKTTFAKGLVAQLALVSPKEVVSPTFTYLHIYGEKKPVFHFDLYRLNEEKFIQLGFLDYLDTEGICIIEWPEKIKGFLPKHTLHVKITHEEGGKRNIHVCKHPVSTLSGKS